MMNDKSLCQVTIHVQSMATKALSAHSVQFITEYKKQGINHKPSPLNISPRCHYKEKESYNVITFL